MAARTVVTSLLGLAGLAGLLGVSYSRSTADSNAADLTRLNENWLSTRVHVQNDADHASAALADRFGGSGPLPSSHANRQQVYGRPMVTPFSSRTFDSRMFCDTETSDGGGKDENFAPHEASRRDS